jgi:DGQHR domain-containing protein
MAYGLTIPALRGKQGKRTFYLLMTPNSVLNNFFTVNMEPESDRSQRTMDPKHAEEIGEYIVENPDEYVMGAITYAVDAEGDFEGVQGDGSIGKLTIPLSANLRCLDGQHRRVGLKEAIDIDERFQDDSTGILLYVEPDLTSRRQMFSDMNATPKVVAKALNVSFDSRDPFAQAAVRLAKENDLLSDNTEMKGVRVKATSSDLFSLAAVYDALKRLTFGRTLPSGRVSSHAHSVDDLVEIGNEFFNLLRDARSEFPEFLSLAAQHTESPAELVKAIKAYRETTLLLSSTTLRVIAGALKEAMAETGKPMVDFRQQLAAIDFRPSNSRFQEVGFVTPGKSTPNARNQEVLAATDHVKALLVG